VRKSISPFAAPVMLVKKSDGNKRLVIDYRRLNAITIKNAFPLPRIDELLDVAGRPSPTGTKYFSKMDLANGFHQIAMVPEDIQKTAFNTHFGHDEYTVMPFGLCNAPASHLPTSHLPNAHE
jgi:hypothetical protein